MYEKLVNVKMGKIVLEGNLSVPKGSEGIVLFAHGSGSSRHSTRNQYVAGVLQESGLSTLLIDLLTIAEERVDAYTMHLRFDIGLLAQRLAGATDWLVNNQETRHLNIGYFGASTGAAAALVAATKHPDVIRAIVSRGGRPDLAGSSLPHVIAPTLLIVGGDDTPVIELNEQAREQMRTECKIVIVPGATHLFEEPGKLEEVAKLATDWFAKYLTKVKDAKSKAENYL
ncbi:MAG TPA: alpha/beta hydrolase [Nitrososphaera sp.]|nr:alpha/beta hydrolase [Nitrososphaera sp.]